MHHLQTTGSRLSSFKAWARRLPKLQPPHRPRIVGYFDGSTLLSNPGVVGAGAWLEFTNGYRTGRSESTGQIGTNNEAEYRGLILLLETAIAFGCRRLTVRGDSRLVINQMTGVWRVSKPELRVLFDVAKLLEGRIPEGVTYEWTPRGRNSNADRMSRKALAEEGL